MNNAHLKQSIRDLLERTDNQALLTTIHSLLRAGGARSAGVWENLTDEERNEVLQAFEESENDDNLSSHADVVNRRG